MFEVGMTLGCRAIVIEDDTEVEENEIFYVTLSKAPETNERITINATTLEVIVLDRDGKFEND